MLLDLYRIRQKMLLFVSISTPLLMPVEANAWVQYSYYYRVATFDLTGRKTFITVMWFCDVNAAALLCFLMTRECVFSLSLGKGNLDIHQYNEYNKGGLFILSPVLQCVLQKHRIVGLKMGHYNKYNKYKFTHTHIHTHTYTHALPGYWRKKY